MEAVYLAGFQGCVDCLCRHCVQVDLAVKGLTSCPGAKIPPRNIPPPVIQLAAEARPGVLCLPDLRRWTNRLTGLFRNRKNVMCNEGGDVLGLRVGWEPRRSIRQ